MAPLAPQHVDELIEVAAQMAQERRQIAEVLDDLPASVTALRAALNQLSGLVR